jgi:tRNA (guanine37-N1)-methyltransferase
VISIITRVVSKALVVPKERGEDVKSKLIASGIFNRDLRIDRDDEFLYLPILFKPETTELVGFEVTEHKFKQIESRIQSYRKIVDVPNDLYHLLPTSFDIVGQIALIKLPDELMQYKNKIGLALLKTHSNLQTVLRDKGVKGELRVRDVEVIAGVPCTVTVHTEYGIKLLVDLWEVYFSPRLTSERYRVAMLGKFGEVVVDMFAGVGPFSIMIAKHSNPSRIFAIDKNPRAIECLNHNIKINKVNGILAFCGDSKTIIKELLQELPGIKADRVIMNLPHSAWEYIEDALSIIKVGGVIHYHEIMESDKVESRINELLKQIFDHGFNCEVETKILVGTYSPKEDHICLDIRITSKRE